MIQKKFTFGKAVIYLILILLSATIVAPDATTADAYATYCMVIGLDAAKEFIASKYDVEGYLIYDDGGNMTEWASSGFKLAGK